MVRSSDHKIVALTFLFHDRPFEFIEFHLEMWIPYLGNRAMLDDRSAYAICAAVWPNGGLGR